MDGDTAVAPARAEMRRRRTELLAVAAADDLVALAEHLLAAGVEPEVVTPPEVGLVVLQVREPVAGHRFHLSEVLVARTEVVVGAERGWCVRLGDDLEAALAAAICEAVAAGDGPGTAEVDALCAATAERRAADDAAAWADVAPTAVRFEELDR